MCRTEPMRYTAIYIKAIEKVQRQAARWVLNRHQQTSSVEDILEILDWPTLPSKKDQTDDPLQKAPWACQDQHEGTC